MKVNLSIWDKLTPVVIFLLFIAGILLVGACYLPNIKQNQRMRARLLELDTRIQRGEETGRQLRTAIDSLNYNSNAVERLARERLGYAKPGETVIRFEEPRTNTPRRR